MATRSDQVLEFPNGAGHARELSKRIDDVNQSLRDLDSWVTRRFDRVDDNQVRTNDALAQIQVSLTKLSTHEETLEQASLQEAATKDRRLNTRERIYAGIGAFFTVIGVTLTAISLFTH